MLAYAANAGRLRQWNGLRTKTPRFTFMWQLTNVEYKCCSAATSTNATRLRKSLHLTRLIDIPVPVSGTWEQWRVGRPLEFYSKSLTFTLFSARGSAGHRMSSEFCSELTTFSLFSTRPACAAQKKAPSLHNMKTARPASVASAPKQQHAPPPQRKARALPPPKKTAPRLHNKKRALPPQQNKAPRLRSKQVSTAKKSALTV